jgi:hypothetical protein
MCFSANASLATFLIGGIGAYLVWTLGSAVDKIFGAFMGFVALMQGIEYILWNNQECNRSNKLVSVVGMWLNHLQPLVLGALVLGLSPRTTYTTWIQWIMALYTAVIIPYSLQFQNKANLQCTTPQPGNPHLVWNWNLMSYWSVVYILFLVTMSLIAILGMPTLTQGLLFAVVAVITFLLSVFFYKRAVVGALWCFFVVFLPAIYYILRRTVLKDFGAATVSTRR